MTKNTAPANCFIIAPISTPAELVNAYGGDTDHFRHVIDHLLAPAIVRAGLNPITPVMQGTDVIHAQIIKQLEEAPHVLCDISSLNANVMLELGIRTALNKPVIIVRDDVTPTDKVPFDVSIINNHTYATAPGWTLVGEIDRLAEHIQKSIADADNALWKYFGLRLTARAAVGSGGIEERLDLLFTELTAARKEIRATKRETTQTVPAPNEEWNSVLDPLRSRIPAVTMYTNAVAEASFREKAEEMKLKVASIDTIDDTVFLLLEKSPAVTEAHVKSLGKMALRLGKKLNLRVLPL